MTKVEILENQKEKLRLLFKEKKFISENNFDDYKNSQTKIKYFCEKGHIHETNAKNLLYGGINCLECYKEERKNHFTLTLVDKTKKICHCCDEEKFKSAFGKNKNSEDGLRNICKLCRRKENQYTDKNKRKIGSMNYHLNHPFKVLCNRCKSTHNKKGFIEDFNISEEYLKELYELQNGKCFWSSINMDFNTVGLNKLNTISVDRINTKIGYIIGNVILTTKFMNLGRCDSNYIDFIQFLNDHTTFDVSGAETKIEELINNSPFF
jgi:hypothetical protein